MKDGHSTFISADDIRSSYFGAAQNRAKTYVPLHAQTEGLTESAKFIIRECKKRLGQQFALSTATDVESEDLANLVGLVEQAAGEDLSQKERDKIMASLAASMDHYDILSPLISNPDINDIIIRNYKDISVQIGRENIQTDLSFADHESYCSFIENLLKRTGKSCTLATPVVDTAIDPHVRACVTHESFSPAGSGPMLTLRIARHSSIGLPRLTEYGLAPAHVLNYLAAIIRNGKHSILIAGEVGTGKTTLVKALATEIIENEAILIIEDTNELTLNRNFVRTLLTREANTEGAGRISPAQAIRTGMRMAMNRIILGEMRDAEAAEAFIDVCASGHSGISTIHARSAKDALSRLELFLARAQGNISTENIRRQLANAISIVVYLGIDKIHHKRRILEVVEVGTSSDGVVQTSPIFTCVGNAHSIAWRRDNGISQFADIFQEQLLSLAKPGETLVL